jgi:hypothetical protein
MSGINIAHIVNPFKAPEGSEYEWQQPIVFKSMDIAWAVAEEYHIPVRRYACFYEEDEKVIPDDMFKLEPLEKSTSGKFKVERKLPYMKEMFDRLYKESDADYFIQTNADIILAPHFYVLVDRLIRDGNEVFCINKRLVSDECKSIDDLPLIWSTIGAPHNGLDCFVFPRSMYPRFVIGDICMGTPWSETTLASSMIACDMNFAVFRNAYVTFHIGDSRTWLNHDLNDYRLHNVKEFCKVLKRLVKKHGKYMLLHPELQIFGYKLQGEARTYGWTDIPEIKYWLDKGFGLNVSPQILSRLVGYVK